MGLAKLAVELIGAVIGCVLFIAVCELGINWLVDRIFGR